MLKWIKISWNLFYYNLLQLNPPIYIYNKETSIHNKDMIRDKKDLKLEIFSGIILLIK
jgi:hypothetical protein